MTSLIINYLLIFDINKRIAKRVEFSSGINIITTEKYDGNDRGKSILMKNLYHTLGADAIFDDLWDEKSKCSLLDFSIGQNNYLIYRNNRLFKVLSENRSLLFQTINRTELGDFLNSIFEFSVKLPDRDNNQLEITPPAYNYVINYIDQDFLNGSRFNAFNGLQHYTNFKENTIYSHFGVFNDEYFELAREKESIEQDINNKSQDKQIIIDLLEKIKSYINRTDITKDMNSLKIELETRQEEYRNITKYLNSTKKSLIQLRNEKLELENNILEIVNMQKSKERDISQMNKRICPTCSNAFNDLKIRVIEQNTLEDFLIIKEQLNTILLELKRKIMLAEQKYKSYLLKYEELEKNLSSKNEEVEDVFEHFGFINSQKKMYLELGNLQSSLSAAECKLEEVRKKIKKYSEMKKEANILYEQYMIDSLTSLSINDVSLKKVSNIKNNFYSRGSNKPSVTVIWHFNLLRVKNKLNPSSIKFPLVMDSPNNGELDDEKRQSLFNFIFSHRDRDTQMILSTLGFEKADYPEVVIDKVIKLENQKYKILNETDYVNNIHLLEEIISKN